MDAKQRILVFDCGNKHTAIVVADVVCQTSFELIYMDLYVSDNMKGKLINFCKDNIDKYIDDTEKCLVIYENVFSSRGYPNWTLISIQKMVRKHYEDMGVMVRTLLPSQKWKLGGTVKNRKEKAVEYAEELLNSLDNDEWLTTFKNIENRRHDVADALLAARYVMDNDVRKKNKTLKKKSKESKGNGVKKTKRKKALNKNVIDLVSDSSD